MVRRVLYVHGINTSAAELELQGLAVSRAVSSLATGWATDSVPWGSTGRLLGDIKMLGATGGIRNISTVNKAVLGADLIIAHSMGSAIIERCHGARDTPVLHLGSPVPHPILGRLINLVAPEPRKVRTGHAVDRDVWNADDPVTNHWLLGRNHDLWHVPYRPVSTRTALPAYRPIYEHSIFVYLQQPRAIEVLTEMLEAAG